MADVDDDDNADLGSDLVNDTVLADADTVMVFVSLNWFRIVWQRIYGKGG